MAIFINLVWLDALIVVFAVTAVWLAASRYYVPTITPVEGPPEPGEAFEPRDAAEEALVELGFAYAGGFSVFMTEEVSCACRAFLLPGTSHTVILSYMQSKGQQLSYAEFNTEFVPKRCVSTFNAGTPGAFGSLETTFAVRVPWHKDLRALFALHKRLCDLAEANAFRPAPIGPGDIPARLVSGTREVLEYQVQRARLKRIDEDTYRHTLLGALLAVPLVWLNMAYGILFLWYRRSDDSIVRRAEKWFERAAFRR
ncbi:MAG: hypothetical protein JXR94_22625 [Candidatus Hydrogenedentes bacterium]|nr:hypothetical protein [Candidatus Hydrogenedentota bacterium]